MTASVRYEAQLESDGMWCVVSAENDHRIPVGRGHARRIQAEVIAASLMGDWKQAEFAGSFGEAALGDPSGMAHATDPTKVPDRRKLIKVIPVGTPVIVTANTEHKSTFGIVVHQTNDGDVVIATSCSRRLTVPATDVSRFAAPTSHMWGAHRR